MLYLYRHQANNFTLTHEKAQDADTLTWMLEAAICFHLNIGLVGLILISRWQHHITYTFVVMWFVSLYPMSHCAPLSPIRHNNYCLYVKFPSEYNVKVYNYNLWILCITILTTVLQGWQPNRERCFAIASALAGFTRYCPPMFAGRSGSTRSRVDCPNVMFASIRRSTRHCIRAGWKSAVLLAYNLPVIQSCRLLLKTTLYRSSPTMHTLIMLW